MSPSSILNKLLVKFRSSPKVVGASKLPLDVLEVIVDQADRPTQLKLSLVSQCIMRKSRNVLFNTLVFVGNTFPARYSRPKIYQTGDHLNRLFELLESPTETIASHVRTIQIGTVFQRPFKYGVRRNMHLLAMKLCNLTTFRLISIDWDDIPPHILDFFFALCPNEVQLECLTFERVTSFVHLLRSPLIASAQKILLFGVHVNPAVAANTPIFVPHHPEQVFHLSMIDASSLVNFHQLWNDDFIRTKVTIDSFHLLLTKSCETSYEDKTVISFIKKVLFIGSDLQSLFVTLLDYKFLRDMYAQVGLSQCTTVRVLRLLMPAALEYQAVHDVENVWSLLDGVPVESIERIDLILNIGCLHDDKGLVNVLQSVAWTETARRLRVVFPLLQHVQFIFGDRCRTGISLHSVLELISRDSCQSGYVDIKVTYKTYVLGPFQDTTERCFLWRSLLT
ncbi:hypothetical protein H2248_011778 [Termitomyces sp. 'cryptogamus']|nr:hypothetical protein H2248_011778 [Termitomyces sp. 'cryptogamus']